MSLQGKSVSKQCSSIVSASAAASRFLPWRPLIIDCNNNNNNLEAKQLPSCFQPGFYHSTEVNESRGVWSRTLVVAENGLNKNVNQRLGGILGDLVSIAPSCHL